MLEIDMEVFVISLSTASQRRQHINQEFAKKTWILLF
jgi:hypothetical protein